jgi:predicted negative regulator of RcsB-dependent stress response
MPGMWWVVGVVVAVALLSAYLFWTAHRVERVHRRAQSGERSLDAHLMRRAAAAAVVAELRDDDELYAAARAALDAAPDERESAENDLTRQLQTLTLVAGDAASRTLVATSRRVVLARQVHTDLVRDALTSRERLLVRVLLMARRYPRPQYFDIVEPHMPEPLPAPAVVPAEAV